MLVAGMANSSDEQTGIAFELSEPSARGLKKRSLQSHAYGFVLNNAGARNDYNKSQSRYELRFECQAGEFNAVACYASEPVKRSHQIRDVNERRQPVRSSVRRSRPNQGMRQ